MHFLIALLVVLQSWWGNAGVMPANLTPVTATTTARVVRVIDGDTIEVKATETGEIIRVRYIGIDTPEPYAKSGAECGSGAASVRNRELVDGKTVTVVSGVDALDDYDRQLAYVYVGETFVNEILLREGQAELMMISPNTEYCQEFSKLQTEAKRLRLGMWSCSDNE